MPRFLFACTAFFQYLMGMNQDKYPHSVVTIKLMSVLPTRLYLLPFNHEIVGTAKTYCFDQISVYQKLVVFFRIPLLNQKCFLKVVFISGNVCSLQVSFLHYRFSGQCFG